MKVDSAIFPASTSEFKSHSMTIRHDTKVFQELPK